MSMKFEDVYWNWLQRSQNIDEASEHKESRWLMMAKSHIAVKVLKISESDYLFVWVLQLDVDSSVDFVLAGNADVAQALDIT